MICIFNDDDKSSSIKIKDEKKCDKAVEISVSTLRSCEGSATCLVARLESGLHLAIDLCGDRQKIPVDSWFCVVFRAVSTSHKILSSKENNETSILPFHDVTLMMRHTLVTVCFVPVRRLLFSFLAARSCR